MKHTPGPWIDSPNAGDAIISQHPDAMGDAGLEIDYYGGFVICESVSQRNKPLIKAAPELLEVAVAWMTLAQESLAFRLALTSLEHDIGNELLKMTDAAIAKVEEVT